VKVTRSVPDEIEKPIRHGDRFVAVFHFQQRETADDFLRFGERPGR